MANLTVKAKVLRWGNSYGLRIRKEDLQRLGLWEGAETEVEIHGKPAKVDLSGFKTYRTGEPTLTRDHDKWAAIGAAMRMDDKLAGSGAKPKKPAVRRKA